MSILRFGQFEIPYLIERSAKARKVRIVADAQRGIVVTIPDFAREHEAHQFVEAQADWVFKHWRRQERLKQLHSDHLLPLQQRPEIWYLGRTYRLLVESKSGRPEVHFDGEKLVVKCFDQSDAQRLLERWYRQQANAVIGGALIRYADAMRVKYLGFVLKDQKTRWGSCSSEGNLNFNWRLIRAPQAVLEYVVVHELAHLREMNHSERFWRIVGEFSRDYKKHTKWLKENAFLLHI